MINNYLKISEFSKLSGISRKLLIYYDNQGILQPKKIDPDNGYRYYSYRQIDTASVIVSLRETGMSLKDIKQYITNKAPKSLIEILYQQENELKQQIKKLNQIKDMISAKIELTHRGIETKNIGIHIEEVVQENLFLGLELPNDSNLSELWKYLPDFYKQCKLYNIQMGLTVGIMVLQKNLQLGIWNKPSHYYNIT